MSINDVMENDTMWLKCDCGLFGDVNIRSCGLHSIIVKICKKVTQVLQHFCARMRGRKTTRMLQDLD